MEIVVAVGMGSSRCILLSLILKVLWLLFVFVFVLFYVAAPHRGNEAN